MGHEIVYCSRCLNRLTNHDFESGGARKLGNTVACATCAEILLAEMSPGEREAALRSESTTRSRVVKDSTRRSRPLSPPSTRAVRGASGQTHAYSPPPAGRSSPMIPLMIGVAVVVGVGLLVLLVLAGGDSAPPETPTPPPVVAPPPDRPAPPPPEESPELKEARALYRKIRAMPSDDLMAKIKAYDELIRKAGLTPVAAKAKTERDALAMKLAQQFRPSMDEIEKAVAVMVEAEQYQAAGELYQASRDRFDLDQWRGLIDGKIRDLKRRAESALVALQDKAAAAKAGGSKEEVLEIRRKIEVWGYPDLLARFDAHLKTVKAPKMPSKELLAYRAAWSDAMPRAAGRDFAGALARLKEAARDVPSDEQPEFADDSRTLARLQTLHAEVRRALARLPRGRKVTLRYFDPAREVMEVDGVVVEAGPHRVEFLDEDGPFFIEFDDVTTESAARLYAARIGKPSAENARAFALGCLLEGDADAAKTHSSDVPDKYLEYAGKAKGLLPRLSADEAAARKLLHAADIEFREAGTLAAAVVKYRRLEADYAGTRAVRRALQRILKRKEAGKEYVFFHRSLTVKGTFKEAEFEEVGPAWASGEMAPELSENYVEFEFSAMPGLSYTCWALAGGCCAEVFETFYQATDLMERNPGNRNRRESAAPGSGLAPPVKHRIRYLKRSHESHGGPKHPARWEWMPIALPKYESPGPKVVRLFNEQKGFGVAAVIVSSTRKLPPRKEDLAELRKKDSVEPNPLLEGLLGWWKLDEVRGTAVKDSAGAFDGEFKGPPVWETGKLGGALKINVNGYVEVGHDPALNAYPLTITAWIKTTGGGGAVLNKYLSGSRNGYQLHVSSSRIRAWYFKGTGHCVFDGKDGMDGGPISDDAWHHVAFAVNDAGGRLYVDGELKEKRAWTGTPGAPTTTQILNLGSYPSESSFGNSFKGLLDDVRLYGRSLTEAEILQLASGDPGTSRSAAEAAATDAVAGWEKIFDGETLDWMSSGSREAWKVDGGAIVHVDGIDNAAQSNRTFNDAQFRVRFEPLGADYFRFNVRQGGAGSAGVQWEGSQLKALEGKPHELIVTCRGDEVTATLDGDPVTVTGNTSGRSGRVQFNVRGGNLRITSLDVRP